MSEDLNLDLTHLFNDPNKIEEPRRTEAELKRIDELGTIGEADLRKNGSYVQMVTARNANPRKPSECTVLVVEDDDGTAKLITSVLDKAGYRTRRAGSRREIANGLSAQPRPNLVLLDVGLPDINGFDVLNRIKQHGGLQGVAVVMVTSRSDKKDITKGLTLGADGYLSKPLLPSALLDAVKAVT